MCCSRNTFSHTRCKTGAEGRRVWSWFLGMIARHVWGQDFVILPAPIVHELVLLLLLI